MPKSYSYLGMLPQKIECQPHPVNAEFNKSGIENAGLATLLEGRMTFFGGLVEKSLSVGKRSVAMATVVCMSPFVWRRVETRPER